MEETDEQNVVSIARSILDGSMPLLLGCHRMVEPLARLGVQLDPEFIAFVGIDSEICDFPLTEKERKLWNAQALIEKDKEMEQCAAWAERLKPREACEAVIKRFASS